jgi:Holliday junction resolvase-like predicted endonuclease
VIQSRKGETTIDLIACTFESYVAFVRVKEILLKRDQDENHASGLKLSLVLANVG